MTQSRIQEEAAMRVQAMIMQTIKEKSADLARLMDATKTITDPARGKFLDVLM